MFFVQDKKLHRYYKQEQNKLSFKICKRKDYSSRSLLNYSEAEYGLKHMRKHYIQFYKTMCNLEKKVTKTPTKVFDFEHISLQSMLENKEKKILIKDLSLIDKNSYKQKEILINIQAKIEKEKILREIVYYKNKLHYKIPSIKVFNRYSLSELRLHLETIKSLHAYIESACK